MVDNEKTQSGSALGGAIAANMPDRKRKLKIWAIRSLIVVVAAYAIVAMNGPGWLVWLAWAYVALTLVLAFVLTRGQSPQKSK